MRVILHPEKESYFEPFLLVRLWFSSLLLKFQFPKCVKGEVGDAISIKIYRCISMIQNFGECLIHFDLLTENFFNFSFILPCRSLPLEILIAKTTQKKPYLTYPKNRCIYVVFFGFALNFRFLELRGNLRILSEESSVLRLMAVKWTISQLFLW